MTTDSLLPMSINNTSSVEQGIDLDALLLSANLSGTDDVLTGILQNDTVCIHNYILLFSYTSLSTGLY